MLWYEHLERDTFIRSIYTIIPELNNVRIEAVKIIEGGRKATLNFVMPKFADKPPEKWIGLGYNAIFVELDFFDIKELSLEA